MTYFEEQFPELKKAIELIPCDCKFKERFDFNCPHEKQPMVHTANVLSFCLSKQRVKESLLKWKKEIQTGGMFDLNVIPESERGEIAKDKWDETDFGYGAEYGAIGMLLELLKDLGR